jgi:two-component system, response regulator
VSKKDLNLVIVDDDEHDYELLSHILEEFNFPHKKIWVKDGEEAIGYIEKIAGYEDQAPYKSIFLMDINLPKINGLELVKIIKNHPTVKDSSVIMVSGSKTKSNIETAKKNGSDYFLKKPFGKQEIDEFKNSLFSKLSSLI